MIEVYLLCLLIGGGLIALSIAGGGDVDADGVDADLASDVDVDVDADVDADVELDGEGLAAAARFLSIRNLIFGAAFFGLTGSVFTAFGVHGSVTLAAAVGMGLGAAVGLQRLMDYMRRTESGAPTSLDRLAGSGAEVLVGLSDAGIGKVYAVAAGQTFQLPARPHEDASVRSFRAGEQVVIVRVDEGVARVAEPGFLS